MFIVLSVLGFTLGTLILKITRLSKGAAILVSVCSALSSFKLHVTAAPVFFNVHVFESIVSK